jgi:hypothetical protein
MFNYIYRWLHPLPALQAGLHWDTITRCTTCDTVQLPAPNARCLCGGSLVRPKIMEDMQRARIVALTQELRAARHQDPLPPMITGWNPRSLLKKETTS